MAEEVTEHQLSDGDGRARGTLSSTRPLPPLMPESHETKSLLSRRCRARRAEAARRLPPQHRTAEAEELAAAAVPRPRIALKPPSMAAAGTALRPARAACSTPTALLSSHSLSLVLSLSLSLPPGTSRQGLPCPLDQQAGALAARSPSARTSAYGGRPPLLLPCFLSLPLFLFLSPSISVPFIGQRYVDTPNHVTAPN